MKLVFHIENTDEPDDVSQDTTVYVLTDSSRAYTKIPTPTLSASRNASTITISISGTIPNASYYYGTSSSQSSQTTSISSTATMSSNSAYTFYAHGEASNIQSSDNSNAASVNSYSPLPQNWISTYGLINSSASGSSFTDIEYIPNNNVYVASTSNRILYSYDLTNWIESTPGTELMNNREPQGLLYSDGWCFVYGQDFLSIITNNGNSWQDSFNSGDFGSTTNIKGFAYGNGVFVLAGSGKLGYCTTRTGTITSVTPPDNYYCTNKGLIFSKNNFYISSGSRYIFKSSNGISWTTLDILTQLSLSDSYEIYDLLGCDKFIIIRLINVSSTADTDIFAYSTDGSNFIECSNPPIVESPLGNLIGAYGNGVFVLGIKDFSTAQTKLFCTTDGSSYTLVHTDEDNDVDESMKYINGRFVGVGNNLRIDYCIF